jgi:hypothetical protein
MMTDLVMGLLVTAVPAFAVGYLMLNKQPPIFRMFIVLVLVGLGYLTATGAIEDIGAKVQGNSAPTPVAAPQPAPATEAPKAAAPAAPEPAAETKAEAAPEPTAETKTEPAEAATTAPPAADTQPEAATTPEAAQPPASTQVDPYPGAPKPAQ